jgi:integrase
MAKKKSTKHSAKQSVRFDNHHIRLRTGEVQRDNGKYMYRWTTQDGERHCVYGATLEMLREQEEQVIVDKHDGIKTDVKALTVNELFDLWCQLKRGIKDSTFKNYIYMYEMFVRKTFGRNRVVAVKKSDVRRFYNDLADGKILKVATIETVHNVLHQVFQVAVDDSYIRVNPADNMLKELKLSHNFQSEKRKALTIQQQELFINYLKSTPQYNHWYPVFYIMVNTGMRVGEITGLRWCDIDMNEGLISVNHTLVYYNHRDEKGCYFTVNTPKTEAGNRVIPMTAEVKHAFDMERDYQREAGLQSLGRVDGFDDFIFVNRNGQVQTHSTLNKAIKRIIRDCNDEILEKDGIDNDPILLPDFSCHNLRHTFATRLCESGINLKVIQDVLGHADVSTTMNIYIDVTNDLKKKEIASFGNYLTTGVRQDGMSVAR